MPLFLDERGNVASIVERDHIFSTVMAARQQGFVPNLSGMNLCHSQLAGLDLHGVNLAGSSLWSANLSGANLTSADLRGASLRSATLEGANLCGADLTGVRIGLTDFSDAKYNAFTVVTGEAQRELRRNGQNVGIFRSLAEFLLGPILFPENLSEANLKVRNQKETSEADPLHGKAIEGVRRRRILNLERSEQLVSLIVGILMILGFIFGWSTLTDVISSLVR